MTLLEKYQPKGEGDNYRWVDKVQTLSYSCIYPGFNLFSMQSLFQ